jgi:hypothetical protein
MAKATIGGETIEVDAAGFPVTYDLTDSPELAPDAPAAADPNTPTPGDDVANNAPAAPAATPTTDDKPKGNGKPAAVPGPTNTAKTNPNTNGTVKPKAKTGGKGKPAAKKPKAADAPPAPSKPRYQGGAAALHVVEPKGERMDVPVKSIIRDRRFQMRASAEDAGTVERYAQTYRDDPDVMPPVKIIRIPQEEADALGFKSRLILWDGFQRTAARELAAMKSIPAVVADGDVGMVTRLALTANSSHGMPRTFADMQRAFRRLLDDEELKAKVLAEGVGKGGAVRALAAAVGCSTGYVTKTLRALGLKTAGDKIVNLPKSEKPAATPPAQAPEVPAAVNLESKEALKSRVTAGLIHDMAYAAAGLQRRYQEVLARPDGAAIMKELAAKHGIPFTDAATAGGDENSKPGDYVPVENWPAVDALYAMLSELHEQHQKIGVAVPST